MRVARVSRTVATNHRGDTAITCQLWPKGRTDSPSDQLLHNQQCTTLDLQGLSNNSPSHAQMHVQQEARMLINSPIMQREALLIPSLTKGGLLPWHRHHERQERESQPGTSQEWSFACCVWGQGCHLAKCVGCRGPPGPRVRGQPHSTDTAVKLPIALQMRGVPFQWQSNYQTLYGRSWIASWQSNPQPVT